MLLVLESPDAMASLPIVNKDFSVFGLVAQRPRQATVIFVRVSQNDAPNITDADLLELYQKLFSFMSLFFEASGFIG